MKYKSFLYLLLILSISSCKKYLDKKPDDKLAVPTKLQDLQALLDQSQYMNIQQSPSFGEASADDYFLPDANFNALPVEQQGIYTWNRGEYKFQNDWSKAYLPVYNANFCLEQLDKIPVNTTNETAWKNVKGSALFFKAYNYLNLLWVFAKAFDEAAATTDLGIVLRNSSDFNVPSVRATVLDSYNAVINDSKQAIMLLPDHPVHCMRPSKAAAYGLLARAYLSMRKYDSAFVYAGRCLQLRNELIDYNADSDINGSITSNVPFKRFNKETIFYTETNTNFAIHRTSTGRIDTMLYAQYNNNDLRKTAFFRPVTGYYQFKGNYTGSGSQFFSGITTAELLLIRAETHARAGRVTEAMNDVNKLMIKRWKNTVPFPAFTANTKEEALTIILAERRKELCMRALRWMDIKRLNKENAAIILTRKIAGQIYTLQPNANYYALPLPTDIIQITGIQQN
ncbi:RagB/SusD family nutrient uptake outer membrane protein [Lacibacter sp. H375]|uniref:RagB/SusD family nutrient uptake outer membrane protein n=1 Tax=Lacibacter sp. H375 TaxID=3133424 RepID=UPI0030C39596